MKRRAVIALGLVSLFVAGCMSTAPTSGNFSTLSEQQLTELSNDASIQLSKKYSAAKTRLDFQRAATDPFGSNLVRTLRSKGFAVSEPVDSSKQKKSGSDDEAPPISEASTAGTTIRYVIDSAGPGMVRVSLVLGGDSMHRAYLVRPDNSLVGAGAWTAGSAAGGSQ